MNDKKLTDNEIIKALECCFMEQQCNNCPLYKEHSVDCLDKEHSVDCLDTVLENAHALITRQQAENENLKVENQSLRSAANSLKMHYEEAQAEIESLKIFRGYAKKRASDYRTMRDKYLNAKSEAVKEFAERLKENINKRFDEDNTMIYRCASIKDIDNLVKEMVGENND